VLAGGVGLVDQILVTLHALELENVDVGAMRDVEVA
jgi:hypothetical protein